MKDENQASKASDNEFSAMRQEEITKKNLSQEAKGFFKKNKIPRFFSK